MANLEDLSERPLTPKHIVSRPHILYNISTTLYNTRQSTALQQFYSLQPLQHPSAPTATDLLLTPIRVHPAVRCGRRGGAHRIIIPKRINA